MRLLAPPLSLGSLSLLVTGWLHENEITVAVLAFWNIPQLWMGRSPTARTREIQFKICAARLCKCVCVWEGEILTWILPHDKVIATSHQNITPLLNFCYYTSRSANNEIMLARVLFQATENKLQLPFCTILTNTHTHTPFHQPHSGAIQGRGRTGSVTQGLHA